MNRKLTPQGFALWTALPMAQSSHIEARLKVILDTTRRRAMTRPALMVLVVLAFGLALTVATAYSPPRSLMAAITSGGSPSDSPAHVEANIVYLQAAIRRFGDNDPWAGKAYYVLGNAQMGAGRCDDALASYDRCLALSEPPYANSGIHLSAEYERINDLDSAGRHSEAVTAAKAFLKTAPHETQRAFFRANIRSRMPEFQLMRDDDANRAAEKAQYRALPGNPHWTKSLPNGVTVELLGVMQSVGNMHTVWSPDGRLLSRARYQSILGEDFLVTPDPTQKMRLIVYFVYPTGQAITTSYTMMGSKSISFQSGLARSNGVVQTDEQQVNPATAGRRTVESFFLRTQRRTTLRVGVAVGPPDGPLEQSGNDAREWAEFQNVSIPRSKR